jgi:hypothetical protein
VQLASKRPACAAAVADVATPRRLRLLYASRTARRKCTAAAAAKMRNSLQPCKGSASWHTAVILRPDPSRALIAERKPIKQPCSASTQPATARRLLLLLLLCGITNWHPAVQLIIHILPVRLQQRWQRRQTL